MITHINGNKFVGDNLSPTMVSDNSDTTNLSPTTQELFTMVSDNSDNI